MRKVKKRKIWAILGAFVVVIACVFSCILPSTVKKETASADSGIDSSQYESANLIAPFYRLTNDSGITFEGLFNDGSFVVSGSSSVRTYKYLCYFYKSTLPSGTYTLSFNEVDGVSFFLETRTSSGSWYSSLIYGNGTFTVDYNGYYEIMFGISVDPNKLYNDVKLYPMLNKGSTAYPFMPNLNYFYDQGYDAGESEGLGTAAAGFMYGASISGSLEAFVDENQSSTQWVSFGPYTDINYVDSGLSFQQFISYLYGFAPEEWTKTELVYTFANPVPYQLLKVVGAGNSTSFLSNVILTDENNKKYTAKWGLVEEQSLYVLSLPETSASEDIKIKSMIFSWGGGADGLDLSIYELNSKYLAGFADGYNAGNEDGIISGKIEGSVSGYDQGYKIGFTDGKLSVNPNSLSNSIRTFIFSLFDAPFAVIEPFIELDVLGIDLGGIFSLILLVGLVSFVFKVI